MCKHQQKWDHGSYPENNEWFTDFLPLVKGVSNNLTSLTMENLRAKHDLDEKRAGSPPQDKKSKKKTTARKTRSSSISTQSSSSSEGKVGKKSKTTTTSKQDNTTEGDDGRSALTTKGYQRHYAKHDYHDFADVQPTELDLQNIKATRGGVHNPFPTVLHCMMEQTDSQGYSHIVSWQPHGRAFLIHDSKKFVDVVLPMYFKHSKLSSFQRQLSLYGFVRLSHDGPDRGAYYHQCFLRGRPFLCSNIQRTRVKGTWVRTSSSPDTEPDFYLMEPVRDLHQQSQQQETETHNTTSVVVPSWMRSSDPIPMGMMEDKSSDKIQALLEEAIKSTTGCDLMNDGSTSFPTFNDNIITDPSQSSLSQRPVPFFDKHSFSSLPEEKSLKHDVSIQLNQPPAVDAGLQPPPAFPTDIVAQPNFQQQSFHQDPMMSSTTVQLTPTLSSKTVWPPFHETPSSFKQPTMMESSFGCHHQRQSRFPSLPFELRDDDELAAFLTEVDLETEMESELDGLVRTAMV